jgi:hypothetical protein
MGIADLMVRGSTVQQKPKLGFGRLLTNEELRVHFNVSVAKAADDVCATAAVATSLLGVMICCPSAYAWEGAHVGT